MCSFPGRRSTMRTLLSTALMVCGMNVALVAQIDRVPSGSEITVRTNETIDARSPSDSRIYMAVVDRDVLDNSGRVVIRRGSDAELILRDSSDTEVVLDLESVTVDGRRYTVASSPESVSTDREKEGIGANKRTG